MASEALAGLKVANLLADGFEQVEMTEPRKALDEARSGTQLVAPQGGPVRAWKFTECGDTFPIEILLGSARPKVFAALLLPGGVIDPGKTNLQNAGAEWMGEEIIVDHALVTSRKPDDIPAFNREVIQRFAGARCQSQQAAAE